MQQQSEKGAREKGGEKLRDGGRDYVRCSELHGLKGDDSHTLSNYSLAHQVTNSLTHSLIHSVAHSLTPSLARSLTHSSPRNLACPFVPVSLLRHH